ncbi:TetR/AcrR family transcriptional regulator [Solimonas marina]|nr:TetR/AcrR family transcriptional regulator [Solimonas marina]
MAAPKSATADTGRTYGGESAAARQERQRRQFLDAGLTLFGTVGYRATTVRMLCKEAGLIDRYFYKNFQDTEDLLAAIHGASMDHIEAQVLAAIAATTTRTPDAIVAAGLDAFFAAVEDARMTRVCWLEVLGVSPRIQTLYTQRIQRFARLLLDVAQQLQPRWPLDDEEADITTIALVGAISQSAMHWLLTDYHAARATLVSANARLLRGLVGALGEESADRR